MPPDDDDDTMTGTMTDLPDDLDALERSLLTRIATMPPRSTTVRWVDPLTAATLVEAQMISRGVDHTARWLRAEHDLGYYTIGSAGHEANAAIALALRPSDPALLHYRSGGFYMARSMQARQRGIATSDPVLDVLRGMLGRSTDPIAGGRHKVFGNHALSIIPQTSTIASHLPRAVGLAVSFGLARDAATTWPTDSVVVCSFGDASLNHSTAQGAINWAGLHAHSARRVPVLFVCEDNRLGLSVATPDGWVTSVAGRVGLDAVHVDGADPATVIEEVGELVESIRETGRPGFVQLDTVRFLGHAGTDVESAYRTLAVMNEDLDRDPILGAARLAIDTGTCTAHELVEWYLDLRSVIRAMALDLRAEPELTTAAEVMAPLTAASARLAAPAGPAASLPPPAVGAVPSASVAAPSPGRPEPARHHGSGGTVDADALTFARTVNRMLSELLDEAPDVVVFGEDVGRKGGVYGVTRGLQQRFGDDRVVDTLLDEQSILGMALGASLNGRFPIPEIQYLAYLHNAEDQLRGEAATLSFFSNRQYLNPMVVRIASYGYQKGFGGHFHNDNSIAVLRDIPGMVIASPAHPSDAAGMLRTCVDHARSTGAVCVFLEPIARYHDADLHEPGDGAWTAPFDPSPIPIGDGRVWVDEMDESAGNDLTILTWGNGLFLSRLAQRRLHADHGVSARIFDLRWLAPLPVAAMVREAHQTGRVLVVDETRRTGGVGEGIVAELIDAGFGGAISRVAARDSFVPLGAAANLVLVSTSDIVTEALGLIRSAT